MITKNGIDSFLLQTDQSKKGSREDVKDFYEVSKFLYMCCSVIISNVRLLANLSLTTRHNTKMQDPVKLLITFPQSTNIEAMAAQLRNNYSLPQQVRVVGRTKLSCSFETMADLLEIDFINTFGATAIQVINSRTFSQQMNLNNPNFPSSFTKTDQNGYESSEGEFPNGVSLQGELNLKQVVPRKVQRLTSLEDEVIQEEKLRQMLTLFNSNQQLFLCQKALATDGKDEKFQGLQDDATQLSLQSQKEVPIKYEQSMWAPLLGGLALTSVLIGGFKLMKMVMG